MIFSCRKQRKVLIAIAREKTARGDICAVSVCKNSIEKVLLANGDKPETIFIKKSDFKNKPALKEKILKRNPSCVFNLFEGFSDDPQKEADFVRLLECAKVPFTGNGSFALSACLDKIKTKNILKKNNLPVARGIFVKKTEFNIPKYSIFPLFVKPAKEDGSCGIERDSLVDNERELAATVKKRLGTFPAGLLIEEFLPGKEYSVAFIGNDKHEPLGVSEIDYIKGVRHDSKDRCVNFLSYDAKWRKETSDYGATIPDYAPRLPRKLKEKIIKLSKRAAKVLNCKGYFRVDLREANGKFFIIDVNPNPDINKDSGYIKLAKKRGYAYNEIIEKIIQLSNCR